MRHIATIQDLSCLGKCSITVALPVLSAMGISCSVLPTAVLSTHTAFPAPHCRELTEDILPIARHWNAIGADFDAVCVGYLADPGQAQAVSEALKLLAAPVILDPVMGDHGRLYSRINRGHVDAMKALCRQADYLLPNVTEASALTGLPYQETADEDYLRRLAQQLLGFGARGVVITGFCWPDGQTGFFAANRSGGEFSYRAERIARQCHGTGDLFAAVFAGALVTGSTMEEAATRAARFVERVIAATPESSPYGIAFEPELKYL